MRRAFVSLYLVVVCAVLAFSWAADEAWNAYVYDREELGLSNDKKQFVKLLQHFSEGDSPDQLRASISSHLNESSLDVKVFHLDDLANSALKSALLKGDVVPLSHNNETLSLYVLMKEKPFVIELIEPHSVPRGNLLNLFFIVAFYLVIGLAVYFWIWPLSRDLKILRNRTRTLTEKGEQEDIQLSKQSAVYDLASAFNAMQRKITSLLSSQKEMTHAMSHELRTPLARMKFTVASLEGDIGEDDKRLVQLRENISEMNKLISDFLTYASFEESSGNIQFERGKLAPMVERVAESLGVQSYLDIVDAAESKGSQEVWCEWYLMEHCVRILLENAKRFAMSKIRVKLNVYENHYEIDVEDDGPGVPVKEREAIFKAFYQSSDTQPNNVGFGLGLALVSRMMSWHKGCVSCSESELGGAKFQLRWTASNNNQAKQALA